MQLSQDQISQDQIEQYHHDGFFVVEGAFDADEVARFRAAFERDCEVAGEHRIVEEGGAQVRAVYASHQRCPEFAAMVRDPRILGPVQRLLVEDVYVYQFKINAKAPFGGDRWAWHQDFVAWKIADALPRPRLVNVGVFLDDVNEFNGPVIFIPGSHRAGLFRDTRSDEHRSAQHLDPDDIALTPAQLTDLVDGRGMAGPKGPAGSLVFFHPEVVHGSAPNMSPYPRKLLIVTYNDVANQPRSAEPRPDYLVGRDTTPLRSPETAGAVR